MKKLGIIGGMGPLADETFIHLLHSVSTANTDQKHIPFLLDGNCTRPDRSDFLCGKSELSPLNSLLESAKLLVQAGCDCIVMPCNTAHFWHSDIKKVIPQDVDFPSIIELSVKSCAEKSDSGVLLSTDGTRLCGIFDQAASENGLHLIRAPKNIARLTQKIIFDVKSNKSPNISELLLESLNYCTSVILGCTELSRALLNCVTLPEKLPKITDSLSVLAKYVCEKFYNTELRIPYT